MRKLLLLSAAAAALFFSCRKDHSANTMLSAKRYKVAFNVANFAQKQGAFALRHNLATATQSDTLSALNTYFDVLYCFIYNDNDPGAPTIIMQDSTMSNMGKITDSLAQGNYQIIVIAGKKGLTYSGYIDRSADAYFGYGGKWQDAFFYAAYFTVTAQNINQQLTLKRVVSKLEIQLQDNIPLSADSISVTVNPEQPFKILSYGVNDGSTPEQPITFSMLVPASAKGHSNFVIDRIVGNTYSPYSVTITCKDAFNTVIATKTINNVTGVANTKTILSGKLFTGANTQGFTAVLDTTWATNPTEYGW